MWSSSCLTLATLVAEGTGVEIQLWFLMLGSVLLFMGLASNFLRRAPVTGSIIYLLFGLALGPSGFEFFHFNPLKQSGLFEVITEVAVLISLFAAGLKMPVPVSLKVWQAPLQLAFGSVALTVFLIALFAHFALGVELGAAVLLGAVLAPTDPVLATDIQLREPGDSDRLRFTLTSEAGINDGSAFPFVMLGLGLMGLHDLGVGYSRWFLVDLLWATAAAIVIGSMGGYCVAKLARLIASPEHPKGLLHDFIGLGLIGIVYGCCSLIGAWGFLGVFVAAVVLRQTEQLRGRARLESDQNNEADADASGQNVSDASLIFKEHLERLTEVVLVVLIGGTLFPNSWSWSALALAVFVFFVARPVSAAVGLIGTNENFRMRSLCGWFGVRGIGSLYYLMFAIEHGLAEPVALQLIHYTLVVITLSIIIHGITVKPMLQRLWKKSSQV